MLYQLVKWDARPDHLRTMACEWCSTICKEYIDLEYAQTILYFSLRVSVCGLDSSNPSSWESCKLTHTKHHQHVVEIAFNSGNDEFIEDLLYAWISCGMSHMPPEFLSMCVGYLVDMRCMPHTSPRLWKLVVRSIGLIHVEQFEQVGMEKFVALLGHLNFGEDDVDAESRTNWVWLIAYVAQSPEGRRSLPHRYWELMMDITVTEVQESYHEHTLQITGVLEEEEDWDILVYLVGFIWVTQHPENGGIQGNLECVTLSLFHQ